MAKKKVLVTSGELYTQSQPKNLESLYIWGWDGSFLFRCEERLRAKLFIEVDLMDLNETGLRSSS